MRILAASIFMFSALALLSTGCSDKKSESTPPTAAAADEVVLNVPGMT